MDSKKLNDEDQVNTEYENLVQNEFEGQIIRWTDCPYVNKRSNTLLKRKDFITEEFPVIGFTSGEKGKAVDTAVNAVCLTPQGERFEAGLCFSDEDKYHIWLNQNKYIGKEGTVRYLKYSEFGKPLIAKLLDFRKDT